MSPRPYTSAPPRVGTAIFIPAGHPYSGKPWGLGTHAPVWPVGWPPPGCGDTVTFKDGRAYTVYSVAWRFEPLSDRGFVTVTLVPDVSTKGGVGC